MKYMGSKRAMLQNGLGVLLCEEVKRRARIVDLFCGSASVSWFSAQRFDIPVLAVDLQSFSVVLAQSVLLRTRPLLYGTIISDWMSRSADWLRSKRVYAEAKRIDETASRILQWCKDARRVCSENTPRGAAVWRAYGGYYFSPLQSLVIDSLINTLPTVRSHREACLACLIIACSRCAASPGHTAQPFKPNATAGKYLLESWRKDVRTLVLEASHEIFPNFAKKRGNAIVGDAIVAASKLQESDLAFVDPPYSGVHYSRFYHVLETVANGGCGEVSGSGRYPSQAERPFSQFSRTSESQSAFDSLLKNIAERGASAIVTFPRGECSNGLSGEIVESVADRYFCIRKKAVKTRFSTLGGNNRNRQSRQLSEELILVLKPK